MSFPSSPRHSFHAPSEFKGLRGFFWPIHGYELKKVIPLAIIMFLLLFNVSVVRHLKDALINTAPASGTECFSFLKLWGTLPAIVLFMIFYARLSSILSRPQLFYLVVGIFACFFGIFGFVLFPARESLHMSLETMEALQGEYPRLHWIIPLIGNWTYSLFYIFSEMWMTVSMSVLFWQYANDITRVSEAKRVYSFVGILGNLGLYVAGEVLIQAVERAPEGLGIETQWESSLQWITGVFLMMALIAASVYAWMQRYVLTDPKLYDPTHVKPKKEKPKVSFKESMRVVISSPYLGLMLVLVLGYAISINFLDVTWKSQLKLQYPNPSEYVHFMGKFAQLTAFMSIGMTLLGGFVVRRFSWLTASLMTPVLTLISGSLFFTCIVFAEFLTPLTAAWAMTPLLMAVTIGTFQNSLTKGTKYGLFDPTREMAYIPLDPDMRIKGKAVVDGIGNRLGKSGSSLIQQVLLVLVVGSTQISIAPVLGLILIFVCIAWIGAVFCLDKKFRALLTKTEREEGMGEERED